MFRWKKLFKWKGLPIFSFQPRQKAQILFNLKYKILFLGSYQLKCNRKYLNIFLVLELMNKCPIAILRSNHLLNTRIPKHLKCKYLNKIYPG